MRHLSPLRFIPTLCIRHVEDEETQERLHEAYVNLSGDGGCTVDMWNLPRGYDWLRDYLMALGVAPDRWVRLDDRFDYYQGRDWQP